MNLLQPITETAGHHLNYRIVAIHDLCISLYACLGLRARKHEIYVVACRLGTCRTARLVVLATPHSRVTNAMRWLVCTANASTKHALIVVTSRHLPNHGQTRIRSFS